MRVVIDMDNTIADEFGSTPRPGMAEFLKHLKADGHELVLWTNSKRERAVGILRDLGFISAFTQSVFREDYDPSNSGAMKDIRKVNGDALIDDDPSEISFVNSIGRLGILITPFRKGKPTDDAELVRIRSALSRGNGFWARLFK